MPHGESALTRLVMREPVRRRERLQAFRHVNAVPSQDGERVREVLHSGLGEELDAMNQ